ncbi:MAG: alpha/beta hydrolase [Myxococcales bacterium]|jgi:acetyl esterase|nr:alpha/beta hydrolase [Myxococcales bacterium]MBL0195065.1 alpha/beta hydrolase [Myxococcales bacterium]HQY62244.1 alpha/beta hydrolase [Polyangiaceae bacterium]
MDSFTTRTRKAVGSLLAQGFFAGASRIGRMHPRAAPARHGVRVIKDQRYHEGRRKEHLLDVYLPAAATSDPLPIVFYVHGGGFRILSKDTHWIMGLAFARRGYAVFNVEYRLAPAERYPAAIADVCHAYTWVIEHAARFGADPSRVVLAGESAGANLVTSLAAALAYERPEPWARAAYGTNAVPRAVVPACGLFQVSDSARFARRKPSMSSFVAERLEEIEASYLGAAPHAVSLDLADPLVLFERGEAPSRPLPPFFLPVGTKDPLLDDTRRLARALTRLGAVAEDAYYPGEVHAFHAFVMRSAARACWADTFAFLERQGIGPRMSPGLANG